MIRVGKRDGIVLLYSNHYHIATFYYSSLSFFPNVPMYRNNGADLQG